MQLLRTIRVTGWKSIKNQTVHLTPLTVLVGANGAGKSNLLSLFRLLNAMFGNEPGLRRFVAQTGSADSILHFGSRHTPLCELELTFATETGETTYFAAFAAAAGGSLIFTNERVQFLRTGSSSSVTVDLGAGHSESQLPESANGGNQTSAVALSLLRRCRLFHFHDTSEQASCRQPSWIEANRFLLPDAGNLASMLYLYSQQHPAAFRRIETTIRQAVPGFSGFVLEPSRLNDRQILLKWVHSGQDYEFGPHQLSDGSLRLIALATLLLEPAEKLPLLIALDEPELGLHPSTLAIAAEMAIACSQRCQVFLATQSASLLDYFAADDVLVAHGRGGVSEFERLSADKLEAWIDDYSLGEIWEKNVVGGGPFE